MLTFSVFSKVNSLTFALIFMLFCCCQNWAASQSDIFTNEILQKYGSNGTLTLSELKEFVESLQYTSTVLNHNGERDSKDEREMRDKTCQNSTDESTCMLENCVTVEALLKYYNLESNEVYNEEDVHRISPALLYQVEQRCNVVYDDEEGHSTVEDPAKVWGFAILFVTAINICALLGMAFLPLMQKHFYHHLLLFMVALAVGTLAGSAILFLIPQAFGLTEEEVPLPESYRWKSTTIMGGIFMFFMVERCLRILTNLKKKSNKKRRRLESMTERQGDGDNKLAITDMTLVDEDDEESQDDVILTSISAHNNSIPARAPRHREDSINMSFKPPPARYSQGENLEQSMSEQGLVCDNDESSMQVANGGSKDKPNGKLHHGHSHGEKRQIKAVAWMVIFGDGLHNFIDGLSIGAAFTKTIMTGVSVSLAVFCEELPHELGDFAILLNSGMSMRQALFYNFLSASSCYLGMAIGILLGELTGSSDWIFALAGGMFLYISLVDMLPEVNAAAEEEEERSGRLWPVLLLQVGGLLTGYGLMIMLSYYAEKISL